MGDLHGIPFILAGGVLWYWVGRTWEHWVQGSHTLHFSWLPARIAINVLLFGMALVSAGLALNYLIGEQRMIRWNEFERGWHMGWVLFILQEAMFLAWSGGLFAVAMRDLRRCFGASKR